MILLVYQWNKMNERNYPFKTPINVWKYTFIAVHNGEKHTLRLFTLTIDDKFHMQSNTIGKDGNKHKKFYSGMVLGINTHHIMSHVQ